jgi:hypothetical protein
VNGSDPPFDEVVDGERDHRALRRARGAVDDEAAVQESRLGQGLRVPAGERGDVRVAQGAPKRRPVAVVLPVRVRAGTQDRDGLLGHHRARRRLRLRLGGAHAGGVPVLAATHVNRRNRIASGSPLTRSEPIGRAHQDLEGEGDSGGRRPARDDGRQGHPGRRSPQRASALKPLRLGAMTEEGRC